MIITSLEKMESIVKSNKNLFWDGWTVVKRVPANNGTTSKDGVYINGRWYLQTTFELTEAGWDIPKKLLENNG